MDAVSCVTDLASMVNVSWTPETMTIRNAIENKNDMKSV